MRARVPTGLEWRAWMWILGVVWWSRTRRLDHLIARLEAVRPRASWQPGEHERTPIAALAAVRRVHRCLPFGRTCLTESLAALGLLRSLGWPARLRIGVRAPAAPVEAHAWLEIQGQPLDTVSAGYKALGRAGGTSA